MDNQHGRVDAVTQFPRDNTWPVSSIQQAVALVIAIHAAQVARENPDALNAATWFRGPLPTDVLERR